MGKWAGALGASIVALLAPVIAMLATVSALVVCDLITGIAVAIQAKEKISSRGLKKTIVKLGIYLIVIVLSHVTELYLTRGVIPLLNIVTTLIGITELKSCVENLNILSGGSLLNSVMRAIDKYSSSGKK